MSRAKSTRMVAGLSVLAFSLAVLTGCGEEGTAEKAGKEIDKAGKSVGEALKKAGEKAKEATK